MEKSKNPHTCLNAGMRIIFYKHPPKIGEMLPSNQKLPLTESAKGQRGLAMQEGYFISGIPLP